MEKYRPCLLNHLKLFRKHVYLDNNATTSVSSHVRRTMNRVLRDNYGNPSSLYGIARKSTEIMEEARQHVADAIHASPQEVVFTGCATESNNAVLKSVSSHFYPRRKKIISTPIEHPSVTSTLEFLKTQGILVEYCSVDGQGRVSLAELEKMIDDQTFLICCMLANNEIGTIQDVAAVAKLAARRGVLVLSDCVQAFGKIPIDVRALGVDYASFSAHKLHGPKGVGALYVRQGSPFSPLLHGGHQENGMRAGTEGLHNIAGFGAACQDAGKLLAHAEGIRGLKGEFIRRLKQIKPDCVINSPEDHCLPNTLSVTFPGMSNAGLMAMLDYHGIAVSAGSACSTQEDKPSHVLKAIGLSDPAAKETIRFSLGQDSSARDIRYTTRILNEYLKGEGRLVNPIAPAQLSEAMVFDEGVYILDVRPRNFRAGLKSLPNAHEASFASLGKRLHLLPRDKQILVVCQTGPLSYIMAYYLKSKGFRNVSSLLGGTLAWKARYSELYRKYAGTNVRVL